MIKPTLILEPSQLSRLLGCRVILACETFQYSGSFKFRGAWHLVCSVPHRHFLAASSGNFGQALAFACQLLDRRCTIVMPRDSARVKIEAILDLEAEVELIDVQATSRFERIRELAAKWPQAYVVNAYEDELVIDGNSTLATELADVPGIDTVIAPVGGGGLAAGLVRGFERAGAAVEVFGAEPAIGNDAARSFRSGELTANTNEPQTIADGARALSLGKRTWSIIKDGLAGIFEVPDSQIAAGLQALFYCANLKAEPTGALALAALMGNLETFRYQSVCCIVSGGNVDAATYSKLLRLPKSRRRDCSLPRT
ncbi:MAG TPA: pyridoxal-phosphate dependent enzyme [Candidatus Acidoferrales bacterium]|nr:pyridoxal-phosphate dependent enzyme [Candidatus Acidoferrales bacterium]